MAYVDPLSVAPGEVLNVMVSCDPPGPLHADLVRLVSGDSRPHGTGFKEHEIASDLTRVVTGRTQTIQPGSYARLPDLPALKEFQFSMLVFPTTPARNRQIIVRTAAFELGIAEGRLVLSAGDVRVALTEPVASHRWHAIELTVGAASVQLAQTIFGEGPAEIPARSTRSSGAFGRHCPAGDWILAGPGFNGRMEAPRIQTGAECVAAWDFSREMSGDRLVDASGNGHHGWLFQTPTRAVKGSTWDGAVQRWLDDPAQYAAVHFHEDDLTDAGWLPDISWRVPPDLPSGQYAVRLRSDAGEDHAPFFVRPAPPAAARSEPRAHVVYLAATATYLAYANQSLTMRANPRPRNPYDAYQVAHPEIGDSLYEYHIDGSGVHYSSRRRPIVNLKPKTLPWSFNADTNVVAWLERAGQAYDVVTDEDLHREGLGLLAGYRVLVTGTHPEYYSTAMSDALLAYLERGGRLMYLGGNGFYWRIAHHPNDSAIIEVRRAEGGTRAWMADPGEYYHSFTGEYGGLWRRLGRPPNKIAGIGFAAQGFDGGTHYRLTEAARQNRAAFILQGVESDGIIGDYGTQGGGAAGEEIDRHDPALGSPNHAIIIARSEGHRPGMLRTIEEIHMTAYPAPDANVRADMVFFETPAGGAVFSTGSISFAGALSVNNYHNDIETMTRNVLNRFVDPSPFEMPS